MKYIYSVCLLALVVMGLITLYKDRYYGEFVGTHNHAGGQFVITVYVHETREHLNRLVSSQHDGMSEYNLKSYSSWVMSAGSDKLESCTVHVVKPANENNVAEFAAWGNELAHCVYGTYKEDFK